MKDELLRAYEKTTAATRTVFGFEYEKRVYMAILDAIPTQWVRLAKESNKRDGENKLRLEVNKTEKAKLLRKAVMVGTLEIINTIKGNKGDSWEKWVTEHYKQVWKKSSTPYYKDGDITVCGEKLQIKWENATLANESTIREAARMA